MSLDPSRAAAALLLALSACVSGTSPDDGPIRVTFSPGTLTKSFSQGDEPLLDIPFVITVSRPLPGPLLPRFTASDPVFEPDLFFVTNVSATSTMLSITPSCGLSPGVYTGLVTLDLCRDEACTDTYPLTGNAVPYVLTISPGFLVTASVDGVPEPGFKTLCGAGALGGSTGDLPPDFEARVGQTVVLESTVPVTWSATLLDSGCGLALDAVSSTDTSWTAVVRTSPGSAGCGVVVVDATLNWADWITVWIRVPLF